MPTRAPPTNRPSFVGKRQAHVAGATGALQYLPQIKYLGTLVHMSTPGKERQPIEVERVQTGVRLEKNMLKVLKAVAELKDMTLGDLLEGIVLHAFEGKAPFGPPTLKEIDQLRSLYGMTLKASDSHNLKERRR